MLPSAHGTIAAVIQPLVFDPTSPYTDLCTLNCEFRFSDVHDVPPIAAAAPGANTNRTSSNKSWSSVGSLGRVASWPSPNHASSAAAPVPAGIVHCIPSALPESVYAVLLA